MVKPNLIYSASYPIATEQEFETPIELRSYLLKINPLMPHVPLKYSSGLPVFKLGLKLRFKYQGQVLKSDIDFGPSFMFAKDVYENKDGRLVVVMPVDDAYVSHDGQIHRHYEHRVINPRQYKINAIIEPGTLKQLWPHIYQDRSILRKFLIRANRAHTVRRK